MEKPLATITESGQNVCGYCGWTFTVTENHRKHSLHRYCSFGCRYAVEFTDKPSGGQPLDDSYVESPALVSDCDVGDDGNGADVIRWMADLWVRNQHAITVLLSRILFPHWSIRAIAETAGTSRSSIARAARYLDANHPELARVYRMFRGPRSGDAARNKRVSGLSRSEAQQRRRAREASAVFVVNPEVHHA